MTGNNDFLDLPVIDTFSSVADFHAYKPLPGHWMLAVADVVDSTNAIRNGRYKAVNMAGASAIAALSNGLGNHSHPYVFGGDGATMALPEELSDRASNILAELVVWVSEALELTMRAAIVPMQQIRGAGFDVKVLQYRASDNASYSMFSGGGASWAEHQMKAGLYSVPAAPSGSRPDLTGLSCRWDPIPASHGEIVSLIVTPGRNGPDQLFQQLVNEVIAIIATQARDGHPLPPQGPPLTFTTNGVDAEARATAEKGRLFSRKLSILAQTAVAIGIDYLGVSLGKFNPKKYKIEVANNSDFRKFDDGLKMTVDLDARQCSLLETILEGAALNGVCEYGIHKQAEALMTCFVPSLLARDHVHFIDGAGGGYALAAERMKKSFQ